jgi:hypothetical protein
VAVAWLAVGGHRLGEPGAQLGAKTLVGFGQSEIHGTRLS